MIQIFKTPEETVNAFAKYLAKIITQSSEKKENFYLALSGGNTPKLLFNDLKNNYMNKIDWSYVHVFWGDERCVDSESPESNYGVAERLLFSSVEIPRENIHSILGNEDPSNEVKRYTDEIMNIVPSKNNLPCFDLIILGLGIDGHTASIFPDQMELLESDKICAIATHPDTNQKRITLTGRVINNAQNVSFLITGKNKSEVISEIINKKNKFKFYPAAYINPFFGNLNYFLDNESSKKL